MISLIIIDNDLRGLQSRTSRHDPVYMAWGSYRTTLPVEIFKTKTWLDKTGKKSRWRNIIGSQKS